jgi:hypothetical protein
MKTIMVTGFGPFPGAPVNPTEPLVAALAREKPPRVRVVTHIFATSYAAVDKELPALLRRHKPDALLMFGLAAATPDLRIETWAHNAVSAQQDVAGLIPALGATRARTGGNFKGRGRLSLQLPVLARGARRARQARTKSCRVRSRAGKAATGGSCARRARFSCRDR